MPKRFDQYAVLRALELHQQRGIIREARSLTVPGRPRRWLINATGIADVEFTDAEVWAFCLGLAAAHQAEMGASS